MKHTYDDQLREEIEERLASLARIVGSEEVVAYVERLAERMRDEIEEER